MRLASLLFAVALCTAVSATAAAQEVMTVVSSERMSGILTSAGIENSAHPDAPESGDPPLRVQLGEYHGLLFLLNDNTDAQLFVAFDGDVSTKRINEWNRDHRFARAYRDDEGRAVLEGDLDFAGGVTEGTITAWAKLFRSLAYSYSEFVAK